MTKHRQRWCGQWHPVPALRPSMSSRTTAYSTLRYSTILHACRPSCCAQTTEAHAQRSTARTDDRSPFWSVAFSFLASREMTTSSRLASGCGALVTRRLCRSQSQKIPDYSKLTKFGATLSPMQFVTEGSLYEWREQVGGQLAVSRKS